MRRWAWAFAMALMFVGCGRKEKPAQVAPPTLPHLPEIVQAPPPAPVAISVFPPAVAVLEGSADVPICSPVSGYLIKQTYAENDVKESGSTLFLVDTRTKRNGSDSPPEGKELAKVVAPISGTPGRALRGPGDLIKAGDPLTSMGALDPIEASFPVPADFYRANVGYLDGLVAQRTRVIEIVPDDEHAARLQGRIVSIDHGRGDGIVVIHAQFENAGNTLRPGQYVKVRGIAHLN